ncbi:xylulokinase [Rathayibacter soli]|uniref:xylulokinase n=1 Tax=Rathayibacter soli TaxID=3144168 RepID=UPI0027E4CB67|nr:FGGY family carbohydrate kinase [Glaciibacter superstes]
MARTRPVAGVDSSTQSCKYIIVDSRSGELLHSSALPHPDGTAIDPARWWEALHGVGAATGNDVRGLSVAAQQQTTIFLDERGASVHDAILWNDSRAASQGLALRAEWGESRWLRTFGLLPGAAHPVSKLKWLREHSPEAADQVAQVLMPHDWLTWRLLGGTHSGYEPTTDRSEASGTGYWSVVERSYREDIMRLAFGRTFRAPRVLQPEEAAGTMPNGTVLAAGCGDNAATHLGLDSQVGEAVVSIGTSLTVSTLSRSPLYDRRGHIENMADATGRYLPIIVSLNGARTLSSVARMLRIDLNELDLLAAAGAPDADGITFTPYLDGERTPLLPNAKGALLGLTRTALTAENIARAAVLGVACAVADAIETFEEAEAFVHTITAVGGGSRSIALRQAIADLTGRPVAWPEPAEYAARGAARQAAWAVDGELPIWARPSRSETTPLQSASWATDLRHRYRVAAERALSTSPLGT